MTKVTYPEAGITAKRAMVAILAVQLGMGALLAGSDFLSALPRLLTGPSAPALDSPVAPGDQTRRYRPRDLPARAPRDTDRDIAIPDPGDMPTRLRFSVEGDVALLTGQIAPGDAQRFEEWRADGAEVTTLRLHSPGGSVEDALAIGAALRAAELSTVMEAGDICLSACPYILVGGTTRRIDAQAMVGVHQHYFGENTALPAFLAIEDIQFGQAEVMAHLDAMGVDVRVMQHALSTPPEAIYVLLPEELEEYRILLPEAADTEDAEPAEG